MHVNICQIWKGLFTTCIFTIFDKMATHHRFTFQPLQPTYSVETNHKGLAILGHLFNCPNHFITHIKSVNKDQWDEVKRWNMGFLGQNWNEVLLRPHSRNGSWWIKSLPKTCHSSQIDSNSISCNTVCHCPIIVMNEVTDKTVTHTKRRMEKL